MNAPAGAARLVRPADLPYRSLTKIGGAAMPSAQVRSINLTYEVLGKNGPWIVISPGGRRGLTSDRALGCCWPKPAVAFWFMNRRNTGSSDIGFPGHSESHEQAEDLLALLKALGTGPAYVAGCSSAPACRCFSRSTIRGGEALLLWRVTGGPYAAKRKRLLLLTVSTSPSCPLILPARWEKGKDSGRGTLHRGKKKRLSKAPPSRSQMSGVRQS